MSQFNFKLDKVLDLRRETEQLRAQDVAAARREADTARAAMTDLEQLRSAGRARLTNAHGSGRTIGQLQNLEWVMTQVEHELETAQTLVRTAEAEMMARVDEFQHAVRDRQALDRLKERQLDTWKTNQNRAEQKQMDEVALTRHGRPNALEGKVDR